MDNYNEHRESAVISDLPTLPSGNDPAMLPQLTGLNWGAALLSWIWLIPIKPLWAGIAFLVGVVIPFGAFGIMGYLLIKGNELAWTHRPFRDVDEFRAVQSAWLKWGVTLLIVSMAIGILSVIAIVALAGAAGAASNMR